MILLVEDNEDDIFLMKRAVQRLPLREPMHIVVNGQEALDYLQGVGQYTDRNSYPLPSFIFLDLKLPFVHGFDVLGWIKRQPSLVGVPVAILTSSGEQSDRDRARQLGAEKFLVKPPTPEMLKEVLPSELNQEQKHR